MNGQVIEVSKDPNLNGPRNWSSCGGFVGNNYPTRHWNERWDLSHPLTVGGESDLMTARLPHSSEFVAFVVG